MLEKESLFHKCLYVRSSKVEYLCVTSTCKNSIQKVIYSDLKNPLPENLMPQNGDFFKHFISLLMGYLIIIGSAIMKIPQITQILKLRSVVGLNLSSLYFECAENIPIIIYNMIHKYPFATYGESVLIMIQVIIIILLYHKYSNQPNVTLTLLIRNFALLTFFAGGICFFPSSLQGVIPIISAVFSISARVPQIITNFRQGHTGQLSLVSWSMSLAGSSIRIFTTLTEVHDSFILIMFLSGFICNLTLVLQILM